MQQIQAIKRNILLYNYCKLIWFSYLQDNQSKILTKFKKFLLLLIYIFYDWYLDNRFLAHFPLDQMNCIFGSLQDLYRPAIYVSGTNISNSS